MSMSFFSHSAPADSNEDEIAIPDNNDVDFCAMDYENEGEDNRYAHETSDQDSTCGVSSAMTNQDSEVTHSPQGYDQYFDAEQQNGHEMDSNIQDRDDQQEQFAVQHQSSFKRSDAPSTTSIAHVFRLKPVVSNSAALAATKLTRSDGYISSDSSCSSASSRYSLSYTPDAADVSSNSNPRPRAPVSTTQSAPVLQKLVDSTARRPPAAGEPANKKSTSSNPLSDVSKALFPTSPPPARSNPPPASAPASSVNARFSAVSIPFGPPAGSQGSKQPIAASKHGPPYFSNPAPLYKKSSAGQVETRSFLSPTPTFTSAAGPSKSGKPPNAPLPAPHKPPKEAHFQDQPQYKPVAAPCSSAVPASSAIRAAGAAGATNLAGNKRDAGGTAVSQAVSTFGTPQLQFRPSPTTPASAASVTERRAPQHAPAMHTVTPATKTSRASSASSVTPGACPPAHPGEAELTPQSTYVAQPVPEEGQYQYEHSQSSGMSPLTQQAQHTQQTEQVPLGIASAPAGGDSGQEAMARCAEVDAQVAALGERLQQARVSLKQVKTALVAQIADTAVAESKILSEDCMVIIAPLLLDLKEKLFHLRNQWEQSKQPPAEEAESPAATATTAGPSVLVQDVEGVEEVQALEVPQLQAPKQVPLEQSDVVAALPLLIAWV